MRRMVSFLLILAFCLSLACPVFATVPSPGEDGPPKYPHFWGENPKTGDNTALVLVAALMVTAAAAFVTTKKFAR